METTESILQVIDNCAKRHMVLADYRVALTDYTGRGPEPVFMCPLDVQVIVGTVNALLSADLSIKVPGSMQHFWSVFEPVIRREDATPGGSTRIGSIFGRPLYANKNVQKVTMMDAAL